MSDLNTEVLKAKRANADRIKDFSKQLNEFNKLNLLDQKKVPHSSEASGVEMCRKKMESNRERGMQFAKQIPRPSSLKTKSETATNSNSNSNSNGDRDRGHSLEDEEGCEGFLTRNDEYGMPYDKASKLQELQAKHEDSRRNVQAIRKSMGM